VQDFYILLYIFGFGLLIAALPACCTAWLVWWLTKRLPVWLRLQITIIVTTFASALACTPIGAAGEGGGGVFPLGIILPSILQALIFGLTDFHEVLSELRCGITFLCVWAVLYLISMLAVGIGYFFKRVKTYQTPVAKLPSNSSTPSSFKTPQIAVGITADEKLAPFVKKQESDAGSENK
jgi:hypothetical protein